jgi:enamine deaminase RidA (YjgF/YER057c/UK114 family)
MDGNGEMVGADDLAAQTEQVMENLGVALSAAGASFEDVVKITTFVVDYQPEHRGVISEVRSRYLPAENPPASTLVGIAALAAPGWLIEIEAVAVTG